jgi:hypothetical protein
MLRKAASKPKARLRGAALLGTLGLYFTFLLGLPAAAETVAPAKGFDAVKSIGVISAVGDSIHAGTKGLTVFSTHEDQISILDMGLDGDLEKFVSEKINPRFNVQPIQFDRAQFSTSKDPEFVTIGTPPPPIAALVKALDAPVDAYLVISKAAVPFGVNEQALRPGFNIGKGGAFTDTFEMYAFIDITLFDARTHLKLAHAVYPAPISRLWGGTVESLPFNGSLWPTDLQHFTQMQHDQLKDILSDDLHLIVSKGLGRMGLL